MVGRRARLLWVLVVDLLMVGCITSPQPDSSVLIGDAAMLADTPGMLLVLGDDGEVSVLRPDGSERRVLAPAISSIKRRTQPTWSPGGERVAWTEMTADGEAFLVTAAVEGGELTRDTAPFVASYVFWDPTGQRIALSGNDIDGRLLLAMAVPGTPSTVIDEGAPMWLDWDSTGSRLLVHIEDRFEFVPVDGGPRLAVKADGQFRVGVHVGQELVFATASEVGETLVVGGADGAVRTELLRVGAPTAFVVDPAAERLAVMSTPSASTLALSRVEPGSIPILEHNRLTVVHLADGTLAEVALGRAVAWFWSPAGELLLYSSLVTDGQSTQLQWHTWDGKSSKTYETFTPTGVFGREYLAFFDQFARSLSFWAPDGTAFVYAGGSGPEDRGIWVQPVEGGSPVRVALGETASWSPSP